MQSDATTVAEYLAELPADRRAALEVLRQTILTNLHAQDPLVHRAALPQCLLCT